MNGAWVCLVRKQYFSPAGGLPSVLGALNDPQRTPGCLWFYCMAPILYFTHTVSGSVSLKWKQTSLTHQSICGCATCSLRVSEAPSADLWNLGSKFLLDNLNPTKLPHIKPIHYAACNESGLTISKVHLLAFLRYMRLITFACLCDKCKATTSRLLDCKCRGNDRQAVSCYD